MNKAIRATTLALLFLSLSVLADPVTLSCTLPTLNEDGSALTDLVGVRFYESQVSGGPYTLFADQLVADGPACDLVIDRPVGTYYFVATAYNTGGVESYYSGEASKTVPTATTPEPPTGLTVTGELVAYGISQSKDKLVTYPVGTVPLGTPCDSTMQVNGLYLVPVDTVEYAGTVRPAVVLAECSGG